MSARLSRVRKSDQYGAIQYHSGKTEVTSLFQRIADRRGTVMVKFPDGVDAFANLVAGTEYTTFSEQGQGTSTVGSTAFFFQVEHHGLKLLVPIEKVKVWI